MARTLPKNKTKHHQLIIKAVKDYYGASPERTSATRVALYIMGRKARLEKLTDEEKIDVFVIKTNLSDKVYSSSFE